MDVPAALFSATVRVVLAPAVNVGALFVIGTGVGVTGVGVGVTGVGVGVTGVGGVGVGGVGVGGVGVGVLVTVILTVVVSDNYGVGITGGIFAIGRQ